MSVAVLDKTATGWKAELELTLSLRRGTTVMRRNRSLGPLRVQRPFYPEANLPHIYLLHPPGGVVASDQLNIDVVLEAGAQTLITTPGSTKFYRSAGHTAKVRQHFFVDKDACLEWFPQENIFFPGACADCRTRVDLEQGAKFVGWEINCLGRPSNRELFDTGALSARFEIFRQQRPLLRDNLRVVNAFDLNSPTGLRGFPMMGSFFASGCNQQLKESVQQQLHQQFDELCCGVTLLDDLLIVRILGHQTEKIQQIMIPIWQMLRPELLQRPAVLPRIWAT